MNYSNDNELDNASNNNNDNTYNITALKGKENWGSKYNLKVDIINAYTLLSISTDLQPFMVKKGSGTFIFIMLITCAIYYLIRISFWQTYH